MYQAIPTGQLGLSALKVKDSQVAVFHKAACLMVLTPAKINAVLIRLVYKMYNVN